MNYSDFCAIYQNYIKYDGFTTGNYQNIISVDNIKYIEIYKIINNMLGRIEYDKNKKMLVSLDEWDAYCNYNYNISNVDFNNFYSVYFWMLNNKNASYIRSGLSLGICNFCYYDIIGHTIFNIYDLTIDLHTLEKFIDKIYLYKNYHEINDIINKINDTFPESLFYIVNIDGFNNNFFDNITIKIKKHKLITLLYNKELINYIDNNKLIINTSQKNFYHEVKKHICNKIFVFNINYNFVDETIYNYIKNKTHLKDALNEHIPIKDINNIITSYL